MAPFGPLPCLGHQKAILILGTLCMWVTLNSGPDFTLRVWNEPRPHPLLGIGWVEWGLVREVRVCLPFLALSLLLVFSGAGSLAVPQWWKCSMCPAAPDCPGPSESQGELWEGPVLPIPVIEGSWSWRKPFWDGVSLLWAPLAVGWP